MPRLKTPEPPFAAVRRLLLGYEVDYKRMAAAIGMSTRTGQRRLDHPEDLTLEDLRRLCRCCGIPADELRNAIKF